MCASLDATLEKELKRCARGSMVALLWIGEGETRYDRPWSQLVGKDTPRMRRGKTFSLSRTSDAKLESCCVETRRGDAPLCCPSRPETVFGATYSHLSAYPTTASSYRTSKLSFSLVQTRDLCFQSHVGQLYLKYARDKFGPPTLQRCQLVPETRLQSFISSRPTIPEDHLPGCFSFLGSD